MIVSQSSSSFHIRLHADIQHPQLSIPSPLFQSFWITRIHECQALHLPCCYTLILRAKVNGARCSPVSIELEVNIYSGLAVSKVRSQFCSQHIGLIRSKLLRVSIALHLISHNFNNSACGPVDNCLILAPHFASIAHDISRSKVRRRDWDIQDMKKYFWILQCTIEEVKGFLELSPTLRRFCFLPAVKTIGEGLQSMSLITERRLRSLVMKL